MKPILFNTEMVRAILDGRKTTTRRVIKPQPVKFVEASNGLLAGCRCDNLYPNYGGRLIKYPCEKGNILYVRETFGTYRTYGGISYVYKAEYIDAENLAKAKALVKHWRPSIHMPKEAAQIFLRVTDVKAERLQDITDNGANKEGYPFSKITGNKLDDFAILWNSTVKKSDLSNSGWNANPWVWVISFERTARPGEK